ncbi:hypothetical protein A2U01_0088412, partial [Trifolium medium]|nr:hypothetical protein [Trifolium medium]
SISDEEEMLFQEILLGMELLRYSS